MVSMRISPVSHEKFVKVFEKTGYKISRISGDHIVLTKQGVARPIVILRWKEIPVFIIKNNIRTANLSREDYFKILEKI